MSEGFDDRSAPRRTLAGATILQIVPALLEEPTARSAVNVAHALLLAGARALVAGDDGPLVGELTTAGGEWIPMINASVNPFRLRRNARTIEQLISLERIDIVHAYDAGAAWSARIAASRVAVWLVTSMSDDPTYAGLRARHAAALAQGDRVIAPSNYAAAPIIQRYKVDPDQITIVPRAIETATYNPAAVATERAAAMRGSWRVPADDQIVMVPGRIAPWNGQNILPDAARTLLDNGVRGFAFVLVGEGESHARYAREVLRRAQGLDVDDLFRMAGHCADMPAAFAASDIVALPAIEPPLLGRAVAQAQAMGRPVVTTDIGVLPEHVVTPPQFPEEVRTGYVARAGDAVDFAQGLQRALLLDNAGYRSMSARARQFAEYMYSPESVAEAMRSVYTSLLARDR